MEITEIANRIKQKGGTLYLVGGAVRDELLGIVVSDEDYCVTGVTALEFQELFPKAKVRGKSFEVFELEQKEFAMARTERKTGVGHKAFEITTGKEITIQEDLARRDITINSMAKNVLRGELIDPFGGREDLEKRIIRATTEAFKEDPLRVYRVARFAASLEFKVDKQTITYMKQIKEELITLSKERVFIEFKKALGTKKPSLFFRELNQANVLPIHFKEIYDLIGSLQPEKYHPEGDSYNHTMLVLDNCAQMTENLELRFSALVHDLGKGTTPKEMYPHHYGHDKRGVELVQEMGMRVGVPNSWIKCGKVASKEHMVAAKFAEMAPSKKVTFMERVEKSILGLEGLQMIVNADKTGRANYIESEKEKTNRSFLHTSKQCLQEVTANQIKEKYHLTEGIKLGEKLHEERVDWMKENQK